MSSDIPTKRWAVAVTVDQGRFSFLRETVPSATAPLDSTSLSPVEYLLVAAGGCLAYSIQAAITARHMPFTWVTVNAIGEKAPDNPSRVQHLKLSVSLGEPLTDPNMERVLEDAKRMCTVTNTLGAAPTVDVQALRQAVRV